LISPKISLPPKMDDLQPATVLGVPNKTWADVPAEVRLKIYSKVGRREMLKPIPGSKDANHLLEASYIARVSDSGLERVNSPIIYEIREQLHEFDKENAAMIIVHWDCVEQINPLIKMIRSVQEAERKWVERYGNAGKTIP